MVFVQVEISFSKRGAAFDGNTPDDLESVLFKLWIFNEALRINLSFSTRRSSFPVCGIFIALQSPLYHNPNIKCRNHLRQMSHNYSR